MSKQRAQNTRHRIASAALELLRERGTQGMSMRQVALRSGLSLSNLQYHFRSREDLLVGLTEHHLASCRQAVELGFRQAGEVTLHTALQVSLCHEAVLAAAPPFRDLFALARTEPGVRACLDDYYRTSLDQLAMGLAEESGQPQARCVEVATLLFTSIEGFYLLGGITPVGGARMAEVLEAVARSMLAHPS